MPMLDDQNYLHQLANVIAKGNDVPFPAQRGGYIGKIKMPDVVMSEWLARAIRLHAKRELAELRKREKAVYTMGTRVIH